MFDESPRPSAPHRRPFVASGEFWLGAASTLILLALAIGFASWWM